VFWHGNQSAKRQDMEGSGPCNLAGIITARPRYSANLPGLDNVFERSERRGGLLNGQSYVPASQRKRTRIATAVQAFRERKLEHQSSSFSLIKRIVAGLDFC
jgi:hypothetical protein